MTNKNLFSATIFFKENRIRPRKYRNIQHVERFKQFAKKSESIYINWYDQKTKEFIKRDYL